MIGRSPDEQRNADLPPPTPPCIPPAVRSRRPTSSPPPSSSRSPRRPSSSPWSITSRSIPAASATAQSLRRGSARHPVGWRSALRTLAFRIFGALASDPSSSTATHDFDIQVHCRQGSSLGIAPRRDGEPTAGALRSSGTAGEGDSSGRSYAVKTLRQR